MWLHPSATLTDAVHHVVYQPLGVFLASFQSYADSPEHTCRFYALRARYYVAACTLSPRTRQPRLRVPALEVNGMFQSHSDNLKSGCTFVCGADENTSFVYFRLESNIYAQICPDYKPL